MYRAGAGVIRGSTPVVGVDPMITATSGVASGSAEPVVEQGGMVKRGISVTPVAHSIQVL